MGGKMIKTYNSDLWAPRIAEHYNGSIGAVAATITPTEVGKIIFIRNTHATQSILISFDDGDNFISILRGEFMVFECDFTSLKIKGSGAGTTYESIVVVQKG